MNQSIIAAFESQKAAIRGKFAAAHPDSYTNIVRIVVESLGDIDEYDPPDPSRIHVIDDGDYQGTLVYVIAGTGYQPSKYWYVKVSYGSCSGCDTLESIKDSRDDPPTEQQIADYMSLALHIAQGIKEMDEDVA